MAQPPRILYVTGLPRAGSTLLCQLLGLHRDIHSTGHSSPLCQILTQLRHQWSDNDFLLAQLDCDFDRAYARLVNAWRGFVAGWLAESERPWAVDKSRGWLGQIETVHAFDPDFRMLVCVRDLGQVLGSIEAQHASTRLLDFPDHLAHLSRYARADKLLAADGLIGGPLKSIEALQDVPEDWQRQVYYVVFEHLMAEPVAAMRDIHRWLGLVPTPFDPQSLPVHPSESESDSHYRYKYPHRTFARIQPPAPHRVPPRIARDLQQHFHDYYQTFYPGLLTDRQECPPDERSASPQTLSTGAGRRTGLGRPGGSGCHRLLGHRRYGRRHRWHRGHPQLGDHDRKQRHDPSTPYPAGHPGGGCTGDLITVKTDVSLTAAMKRLIDSDLTLQSDATPRTISGGHRLTGGNSYRPLLVKSGTVTIRNLTLASGMTQGGSGNGGGAGLGGALFICGGAVSVENVAFSGNNATGGVGRTFGGGSDLFGGGGWDDGIGSYGGFGGAIFVKRGILTLKTVSFAANSAVGGSAATNGAGKGGAIFVCTSDLDTDNTLAGANGGCSGRIDEAVSNGVTFGGGAAADGQPDLFWTGAGGAAHSTAAITDPDPAKGTQTIAFGAAPTVRVGGTGTVSASGGGSSNPVTFTNLTPFECTTGGTNGSSVTGVAAGTCTIAANQAGNASCNAASQATQSFEVSQFCRECLPSRGGWRAILPR